MRDGLSWLVIAAAALEVSRISTYWLWWRLDQGTGHLPGDWFLIPMVSLQFRGSSLLARYVFQHIEAADGLWEDADALVRLNAPD